MRHRHKRFKPGIWFSEATGKGKVINYANDFVKVIRWTNTTYALSDGTFVGPKVTRGRFIDDNDLRVIDGIRCVEGAALSQMSTQRLEVVATYGFDKCYRILIRRRLGLTLNQKRARMEARLVGSAHQLAFCQAKVLPILRVMLTTRVMTYLFVKLRLTGQSRFASIRTGIHFVRPGTYRYASMLLNLQRSFQSGPLARQNLGQVREVNTQ